MALNRRELCLLFPFAFLPGLLDEAQSEQQASLPSTMFPFDVLPVHTSNNAEIRAVLKGKLATGESLELDVLLDPIRGRQARRHKASAVNFPSMTRRYRATTFSIAVAGALAIAACSTDDGGGATVCTEVILYRFWS